MISSDWLVIFLISSSVWTGCSETLLHTRDDITFASPAAISQTQKKKVP